MHTGIYRSRPRAGSIVHTHAPYSTTLTGLGQGIPPVHYTVVTLLGEGRVPLAYRARPAGVQARARVARAGKQAHASSEGSGM